MRVKGLGLGFRTSVYRLGLYMHDLHVYLLVVTALIKRPQRRFGDFDQGEYALSGIKLLGIKVLREVGFRP